MQISLHSVIIARIKRFEDLNMVIDIYPQADDYSWLIKISSLPLLPILLVKLNEFGLGIDWENILYWCTTYSIDIVHTVSNTPTASTVQKTLKLEKNPSVTLISNPIKRAYTAFNSSSGSHFPLFCLSKKRKLKAIRAGAGFAEAENNTAGAKKDAKDTDDDAEDENIAEKEDEDNIIRAGEKAAVFKGATNKDTTVGDTVTGTGNNARNTEEG